ncbi:MAG TPA: ABC transporter permease [Dehalococcoidia bacterium]|nr:ABC transporter permease [Dehalococcoidia bacterium]
MSEWEKLKIVIWYEFLKHLRRKRLYWILGVAIIAELAVLIGLPALGEGYPDDIMRMAALLSFGASFVSLGAVFFAGDAIAGEFEGKTGYILFPNPVRRSTLVVGKYLACYAAVILLTLFVHVIICISLLVIYGRIPIETAESFGLWVLYTGSVLSVTFFFSSVSKGAMGATVITLVFIMIISGVIETVLMIAGQPIWFLLSAAGDTIVTVYVGWDTLWGGMFQGMPAGMLEAPDINLCIFAMAIYLVVGFLASIWITKRRQLA